MAEPVLMPQVGQDIKTARIVDWLKKENEEVNKGEVIAVVESDKAAFDVEAYTSGVMLKILYPEGREVEVLTPIAYIGQPGERVEDTEQHRAGVRAPQERAREDVPRVGGQKTAVEGRRAVSPSARRLAREKGIRLETVKGSGPGGRITKEDILTAATSAGGSMAEAVTPGDTIIAFSPMRACIAERLTRSKQTIPHFYICMDVDMSEVMSRRQRLNESRQTRFTITDVIVKAVATALSQYARMNAHVEQDKIILKRAVNIGVTVSADDGLIVPVIAGADEESLAEISATSRENAEAARAGRLKPQAIGSFTITNLGMFAVDTFVPVINPPEAAILAVGAVARRAAIVGDQIAVRDVMTMVLACDHRAIDGTYAAQFLQEIKQQLENPASLEW